ncbi:MAG: hypothetical protein AAGC79_09045 [Pseudomonadota bacterium]
MPLFGGYAIKFDPTEAVEAPGGAATEGGDLAGQAGAGHLWLRHD